VPFSFWIRVDAGEIDGERVAALVAALGIEPVLALGHLVALSGKIAQHRPDGDIRTVPPVLLERWASWQGERGAFAAAVLSDLCDPPGILRDWLDTMGKLVAHAEKERRRKKVAYDRERLAREAEEQRDQLELEGSRGSSAEAEPALRGNSAESPTPRNGTGRNGTNGDSPSTGTEKLSKASAAVPAVDKSVGKGKSDPLAGLPASAVRLLTLFYANADGRRKRDVLEQLRDTIDPARPGARLDRNTWVRARSPEELETACALVLRDPPRDLDLGVRFVLHRLTELQARAAKQATEGASSRAAEEERRLDQWRRARAIAVSKWELEHKAEAADLLALAETHVPNEAVEAAGRWGRELRMEHYAALVAERMKFPGADEWKAPAKSTPRGLSRIGA